MISGKIKRGSRRVAIALTVVALIPVIIVVRALRPIVRVRFGKISAKYSPLLINTELYLARREHGIEPRRTIDLFALDTSMANSQAVKMLKRQVHLWRPAALLARANKYVPAGDAHIIDIAESTLMERDLSDLLIKTTPKLVLTDREVEIGDRALRELGIVGDQPIICLHARDNAYVKSLNPDYYTRKNDYRNAGIGSFTTAARAMVKRGYIVVRMGAEVETPFAVGEPGIIDYASSDKRSHLLDIVLANRCQFWLGTPSGAYAAAMVSRKPIVHVNCIPLGLLQSWAPQDLYIPKKLIGSDGHYLSIFEILKSDLGWSITRDGQALPLGDLYDQRGISVIDNTSDEILAIAEEMDDRLSGRWDCDDEEVDRIQGSIAELLESDPTHNTVRARLGWQFIKSNPRLVAID